MFSRAYLGKNDLNSFWSDLSSILNVVFGPREFSKPSCPDITVLNYGNRTFTSTNTILLPKIKANKNKKRYAPVPVTANVSLFGNKVLADIKLRGSH